MTLLTTHSMCIQLQNLQTCNLQTSISFSSKNIKLPKNHYSKGDKYATEKKFRRQISVLLVKCLFITLKPNYLEKDASCSKCTTYLIKQHERV